MSSAYGTDLARADHGAELFVANRKILLVLGPEGALAECLVRSVEREFPTLEVRQVASVREACRHFDRQVALVLAEAGEMEELNEMASHFRSFHPATIVAVFSEWRDRVSVEEVFDSKVVGSFLPMDLKLDVWLSILSLILRGGQYFPPLMIHQYARLAANHHKGRTAPAPRQPKYAEPGKVPEKLVALTDREREILAMVASGMQNKVIAAQLQLSECTVKIHIHNMISKLGVHNRTGAAAYYHGIGQASNTR